MLKVGSQLRVVDNSGAKWSKCIHIKKKGKHLSASIGMLILITLKKFSNRKKVNKRIIYLGLFVGVCYWGTI
jgi:ribosomal protein L14